MSLMQKIMDEMRHLEGPRQFNEIDSYCEHTITAKYKARSFCVSFEISRRTQEKVPDGYIEIRMYPFHKRGFYHFNVSLDDAYKTFFVTELISKLFYEGDSYAVDGGKNW